MIFLQKHIICTMCVKLKKKLKNQYKVNKSTRKLYNFRDCQ